jgi:hypothetical protein
MISVNIIRRAGVFIAAAVVVGALTGIAPAGASAATCVSWTGVQPPNPSSSSNSLSSVAVLSSCNAWAVGDYFSGHTRQTLIEHWNGSSWKQVVSPNPSSSANSLNSVTATSPTNIWAVGDYVNINGSATQTLIEHWNGSSWTQVASPNPGGTSNNHVLYGVTATSPTNIWAVGYYVNINGHPLQTLVLHWDGTAWKLVASPNPAGVNELRSVAVISPSNAWAVGFYFTNGKQKTLIEHWNGTAWRRVTSPNPSPDSSFQALVGVTATSSTNAWAAGGYFNGTAPQTLIAHWNGSSWTQVASPNPGGTSNENDLSSVTATSSGNAWAVGDYNNGTAGQTLIAHWNGSSWTQVASPNPGSTSNNHILNGVAAASATNIWAVGNYFNSTATQTLALHCC